MPALLQIMLFTEEATGFHAGLLFWSNWNLEMLAFVEGGKQENSEKTSQGRARTKNKLDPQMTPGVFPEHPRTSGSKVKFPATAK